MPVTLSEEETRHALAESDESFLECRDLGHSWGWVTDYMIGSNTRGKPAYVERVVACNRCKTKRQDRYTLPDFQRMSSSSDYPKGYLLKGSGKSASKADVRRIMFDKEYEPINIKRAG